MFLKDTQLDINTWDVGRIKEMRVVTLKNMYISTQQYRIENEEKYTSLLLSNNSLTKDVLEYLKISNPWLPKLNTVSITAHASVNKVRRMLLMFTSNISNFSPYFLFNV
jgi:hypothetical protein